MPAPQKFRSAFNGFNREDVAGYLEYLNSKHTAHVNQLNSENTFLRSKLDQIQPDESQAQAVASLEQERDDLRAQLEALQARYDALQTRCDGLEEDLKKMPAPVAAPISTPAEELEIYRRAERTERLARERADLIFRQTNGVLAETAVRVNDMADKVLPMADQVLEQLTQLQQTVSTSRQSLQDAVVLLGTLRPDNR